MQKQSGWEKEVDFVSLKPTTQPPSVFIAKKPVFKPELNKLPMSGFHHPGQRPGAPRQPQYSSLGADTFYDPFPFQPPGPSQQPQIDLTREDDDGFDPDAAITAEGPKFGEPDPYSYVDGSQANENIKNLLQGAFDADEDELAGGMRMRLKKRAKKAIQDGDSKQAASLAKKLAGLEVKEEKEAAAKAEAAEDEAEADEDEEDGTVQGMTVKLLPHQVDGVTWMIDKEIGGPKRNGVLPHGGILADDMGLGKTVQSVALILTNPRPAQDAKPEHPKQKLPGKDVSKCTLVVAPLALIKQWESEIKTKVEKSHALRVLVHHGTNRTKSATELKKYHVVITTYQTLTSEHQGSQMGVQGGTRIGCMGVHWYRVILDEAHSIKNRNAKSTQAVYALNSFYRWCLTGTPMQNNLDELQSLIKFLRIKPYCELQSWKQQITTPMKNGRGGLAMKRLQYFLRAFMKRRTKDILKQSGALNFGGKLSKEGAEEDDDEKPKPGGMQIVNREVVTMECDFDEAEQEFYTRLQNRADKRLKEMQAEGQKADYMGALVLLLRLRQACNHPHLIEMAMSKDKETVDAQMQIHRMADKRDDDIDDLTLMMGGTSIKAKKCDVCQVDLSSEEALDGEVRCADCNADILMLKGSKKRSKKSKKAKAPRTAEPAALKKKMQHKLPDDSDEEGEGEWIAKGPKEHIDLGKAGGTDDEEAEGGGETLDSVDSERSASDYEDEEDSPPRAHFRGKPKVVKHESEEESDEPSVDEDSDSDDSAPAATRRPRGRATRSAQKPSTKIRHLLRILHTETPEHKAIVFSQFTTMLDLIQPHLADAGIRYVRYDGSMRNDAREAALHSLRSDPKTRVLLCSLKCGSLGLNLTAASRVVIVEPFWNPFVEEQAIDRVHRLNQIVDVKVFRLTVRDSVEQRILALQERKRELAKAAIEGAGNKIGKLTMQEILGLFQHDNHRIGAQQDADDLEMQRKFGGDTRLLDGGREGIGTSRDDVGIMARAGAEKRMPVANPRGAEHDVYGRRW